VLSGNMPWRMSAPRHPTRQHTRRVDEVAEQALGSVTSRIGPVCDLLARVANVLESALRTVTPNDLHDRYLLNRRRMIRRRIVCVVPVIGSTPELRAAPLSHLCQQARRREIGEPARKNVVASVFCATPYASAHTTIGSRVRVAAAAASNSSCRKLCLLAERSAWSPRAVSSGASTVHAL